MSPPPACRTLRVAYLAWFYPVVSMTFVQREVAALRSRGVEVQTMALRPAQDLLSETERQSARETWTVMPTTPAAVLLAHVRGFLRSPASFLATLRLVLREMPGTEGRHRRLRALFYFAYAIILAERLRKVRLDHVHVHGGDIGSHVVRLVSHLERGRRRRAPFTWSLTVHGPGELLRPAEHLLAQKVHDADLVVGVSEYGRAQMIALAHESDWHKLEVVHCGIDVESWPRRSVDAPEGPLRILTVGRLHPQKSHHVLIDAVDLLRARNVDVTVTLVGEGPTRPALERQIAELGLEDRVRLVGAVGQSDIGAFFPQHDAFCLASVSEGLPVVLMEAMAAGLPVVTTRITGVPELVEHGVTGLLVPPARPQALAEALQRVVEEPALRSALTIAARAAVRAGFDSDDCAGRLEEHLRRVRAPHDGPPPGRRPRIEAARRRSRPSRTHSPSSDRIEPA